MCAFWSKLLNVPTEPPAKKFNHPVFLLGIMRSGTTLLMNTLSEHPQLLKVGFELNGIWTEIGGAPIQNGNHERTEAHFDMTKANNMTAYFAAYIREAQTFLRKLSRMHQKRFYGSGGVNYDWNHLFPLNKSPHLANKVRYINAIYPESKHIVIVRSPMGQCASIKMFFLRKVTAENLNFYLPEDETEGWQNVDASRNNKEKERLFPQNFNLLAEAWINNNYTMFKHLEHIPEDRKVVISYEELMNNREGALKSIFNCLQLKQEYKRQEEAIIHKQRKIHNTFTKGNPLDKWKKHFTEEEKAQLKSVFATHKDKVEYILERVPKSREYWSNQLDF